MTCTYEYIRGYVRSGAGFAFINLHIGSPANEGLACPWKDKPKLGSLALPLLALLFKLQNVSMLYYNSELRRD
jgi:hypothetical protein